MAQAFKGKALMNGTRIILTAICAVLLFGALAAIISRSDSQALEGQSLVSEKSRAAGSEVVDGYKQWTRVNPVPAVFHSQIARFPEGSVIVKEKLPSKESSAPELLTVMVKREPGYNPQNGDWEYIALDGSGKSVQARGRLENCQACQMMVKDRDYVSRNYLPYEVWKKLK